MDKQIICQKYSTHKIQELFETLGYKIVKQIIIPRFARASLLIIVEIHVFLWLIHNTGHIQDNIRNFTSFFFLFMSVSARTQNIRYIRNECGKKSC